ncbi:hypothetical protein NHX12_001095 [Muraenolepis orangiensis]|uniref:Glyoxylate reductase/hydroxypyruvate reductase n=1 Tax=Muraenolepis orangiensis TaxID=630683 RepID=A0A9Q0E3V4_9TELE|nr:hypothetical protein NHX12_001095 [Muraenolepis orangiensis]
MRTSICSWASVTFPCCAPFGKTLDGHLLGTISHQTTPVRMLISGMVVDQEALVEALQNKSIQAAALDVTYPQPLPREHPLLSLPNVIVLPHMGCRTVETARDIVKSMIANALAALAGEMPPDEVRLACDVVVSGGVGVDHLDIPLINSFGVKVCNTPKVVDNATADLAMGLMLASARNILQGDSFSLCHVEGEDIDENHLGNDVSSKTLGIVGMGSIGYKVAKRAVAFDMKIFYHNRSCRPVEDEQMVGAEYCPVLEDLLAVSDYVVLLVNLTKASTHLIGRKQLSAMKSTATLINVSRGMVVDQEALVEALQNKIIKAAALDVTYPEPLPR